MNTKGRFRANRFTIGAFILSIITGLLYFLHSMSAMSQPAQVWLSSLFVIAVVLHTIINWRQFT